MFGPTDEAERWRFSFDVNPAEHADALVDALRKVVPSEGMDLVTSGGEEREQFAKEGEA